MLFPNQNKSRVIDTLAEMNYSRGCKWFSSDGRDIPRARFFAWSQQ